LKIWLPLPDSLHISNPLLVIFLVLSAVYMLSESPDPIIHCIAIGCLMWAFWISLIAINLQVHSEDS
jgi:hypothetical protein